MWIHIFVFVLVLLMLFFNLVYIMVLLEERKKIRRHEWQKHFRGRNWDFSADLHTQKSICIQLEKTSWLVINIKHTQLANTDRFSCSSLPVLHKPHSAKTIWIISMMRPNRPSNWTTLEPNPALNVGFREYLHKLKISSGHRPLST